MPNQILENIKKHNCYNISYIQSGERYIYTYTKKFFCFFSRFCVPQWERAGPDSHFRPAAKPGPETAARKRPL